MSNLTDRAAYLRGLADGMELDLNKNEHKLLNEMLELMDEMAQKISELDNDIGELGEYMEDVDADLGMLEEIVLDEDDDDCCDCDDCDGCCDDDDFEDDEFDDGQLCFECPNCGKTVTISADDIDDEVSPVCEFCGEPFFTDVIDEEEDSDEE